MAYGKIMVARKKILEMIELKARLNNLRDRIEKNKSAFYKACSLICPKGESIFHVGDAVLSKSYSKSTWKFSKNIMNMEKKLSKMKRLYKKKNAPDKKGYIIWSVYLDEDTFNRALKHMREE